MPADSLCPALFVTGTDTGVGKTLVTAGLARFLREAGLRVGVMKPVETGVADPAQPGDDARLLAWAAECDVEPEQLAPFRFIPAVAPSLAAEMAQVRIDIERIAALLQNLRAKHDVVLVEGAGGLMAPVEGGLLMADLASRLELPLLLITHPALGTLNHTLLTTYAARMMDLELAGFLINRMPEEPGLAESHAPHQLAALASASLLGVLPEVMGDDRDKVRRLAREIAALPTRAWLIAALGLTGTLS